MIRGWKWSDKKLGDGKWVCSRDMKSSKLGKAVGIKGFGRDATQSS